MCTIALWLLHERQTNRQRLTTCHQVYPGIATVNVGVAKPERIVVYGFCFSPQCYIMNLKPLFKHNSAVPLIRMHVRQSRSEFGCFGVTENTIWFGYQLLILYCYSIPLSNSWSPLRACWQKEHAVNDYCWKLQIYSLWIQPNIRILWWVHFGLCL